MTNKWYQYLKAKEEIKNAIAQLESTDFHTPYINEGKIKSAKDHLYNAIELFSNSERCEE